MSTAGLSLGAPRTSESRNSDRIALRQVVVVPRDKVTRRQRAGNRLTMQADRIDELVPYGTNLARVDVRARRVAHAADGPYIEFPKSVHFTVDYWRSRQ
jgi:hypothetical protein